MAGAVPSDITVYAPGLLGPYAGQGNWSATDWPRLPLIQRLLSRADRVSDCPTELSDYGSLCNYFGFTCVAPLPLAALCLLAEGQNPGQACWLRLDPVTLHADSVDIVLLAHDELALSETEADKLLETLNPLLEEWSVSLQRTRPHHWYIRLPEIQSLLSTPISQVMGLAITEHLPEGDDYLKWHRLMNEVQMLWHDHPVNEQRQQRGLLTVNGVWPWGCGVLPEKTQPDFNRVYSDDLVTQGLAVLNDIKHYPIQEFIQHSMEGNSLLVDLSWRQLQLHNDAPGWFEALAKWQEHMLMPLMNILEKTPKARLNLNFGPHHCYRVTRKDMRRWWRKTKSFSQLVMDAQHED